MFTQEQLDNIIQARIMSERKKYEKKIEEEEKQKTELLKQKQIEEAKSKSEIEKLMKERIAEKDLKYLDIKMKLKKKRLIILSYLLHQRTMQSILNKSFS